MFLDSNFIRKLRTLTGLKIDDDTDLEVWLAKKYRRISNFAYDQKRSVEGQSYPIFLNELMTPNAWMVRKDLLKGVLISDDRLRRVRNVGNVTARRIKWTDDKNLSESGDYYLYPSETLTLNEADCEDHAFVMASALPEDLACAWGFFGDGGHCFNVMLLQDKLYVVDTVGDEVYIAPYEGQAQYKIHYIVTPRYTFALDSSVQFGTIAGWD